MTAAPPATVGPPQAILDLAAAAAEFMERSVGVPVDYTSDTLPIVDHYARSIPIEAKAEVRDLVGPALGAYFGEVIRRTIGECRWHAPDTDHSAWRLEFYNFFLYFNPVAMVLEAWAQAPVEGFDAELGVLASDREPLAEAIDRTPKVRADDYYRLSIRYDVIEHVVSILRARSAAVSPARSFGPEVYRAALDEPDRALN